MKRSRYSEEKIIEILRENEAGMTVSAVYASLISPLFVL